MHACSSYVSDDLRPPAGVRASAGIEVAVARADVGDGWTAG